MTHLYNEIKKTLELVSLKGSSEIWGINRTSGLVFDVEGPDWKSI
jgi:hypothetical protein